MVNQPQRVTLYPYRELTITIKVQECFGREFAAKLGDLTIVTILRNIQEIWFFHDLPCKFSPATIIFKHAEGVFDRR